MANKQELYRFRNGVTVLDADTFNRRFFDVDGRLGALELLSIDWEAAIRALNDLGLSRLADLLGQLHLDGLAALAAQQAAFEAAEGDRAGTFADNEATRAAALASWTQSVNALISGLNAVIAEAEDSSAALLNVLGWRDTLNPPHDGYLRPDRLRDGPAAVTYNIDGSVQYLDTTLPDSSIYREAYSYNGDGSAHQVVATLGAVTLWTRTYTYDQAGVLTGWTEA